MIKLTKLVTEKKHGVTTFNPKGHVTGTPLSMKSYSTKGLPKMVKSFVYLVAKIYGLNKVGALDEVVEELTTLRKKL